MLGASICLITRMKFEWENINLNFRIQKTIINYEKTTFNFSGICILFRL